MVALHAPSKVASEAFPQVFHDDVDYTSPLGTAWAPGRVNIIGEHTDYNAGYVLPLAVDRVSAFAGRARNDDIVRLWSIHFQSYVQFSLAGLPEAYSRLAADLPGWARYILAVATELVRDGLPVTGFDAVMAGDVPLGGGMSSSAALEIATIQAFSLFSQGKLSVGIEHATLSPLQAAALGQRAEHLATDLRSGILDQAASCLGLPQKAIFLDCRSFDFSYLPFDNPAVSILVIDTGVRRELASSAYNERRSQCEEATVLLRQQILKHEPENAQAATIETLRDISAEQFSLYKRFLPSILQKRAGYIIAENERVLQVVDFLKADDIAAVGNILWKGHAGLRDEYEVSCQELDALVDIAHEVPGVLGARMMGGGFGGCTIHLVQNDAIESLRQAIEQQYPQRTGRSARIDICRAAAGPGYLFFPA